MVYAIYSLICSQLLLSQGNFKINSKGLSLLIKSGVIKIISEQKESINT